MPTTAKPPMTDPNLFHRIKQLKGIIGKRQKMLDEMDEDIQPQRGVASPQVIPMRRKKKSAEMEY